MKPAAVGEVQRAGQGAVEPDAEKPDDDAEEREERQRAHRRGGVSGDVKRGVLAPSSARVMASAATEAISAAP